MFSQNDFSKNGIPQDQGRGVAQPGSPPKADRELKVTYVVYVIRNQKGLLYKGFTENFEQRLKAHNEGWQRWTRGRGPFELVYKEELADKTEALKREKFLKSGQGREFLKSILNR